MKDKHKNKTNTDDSAAAVTTAGKTVIQRKAAAAPTAPESIPISFMFSISHSFSSF